MGCNPFAWLQRRAHREGEDAAETARKALLLPPSLVCGVLLTLTLNPSRPWLAGHGSGRKLTGLWLVFISNAAGVMLWSSMLLAGVCRRSLPLRLCEVILCTQVVVALMRDFGKTVDVSESPMEVWPICMIILDALLCIDANRHATAGAVAIMVSYLAVRAAYVEFTTEALCGNGDVKCKEDMSLFWRVLAAFGFRAVTVIVDFYFTRGFSDGLYEHAAALEASVYCAEDVALLLADYETERAQELVDGEVGSGRLPPRMRDALQRLLENLKQYRPFLPQSCLPMECVAGDAGSSDVLPQHSPSRMEVEKRMSERASPRRVQQPSDGVGLMVTAASPRSPRGGRAGALRTGRSSLGPRSADGGMTPFSSPGDLAASPRARHDNLGVVGPGVIVRQPTPKAVDKADSEVGTLTHTFSSSLGYSTSHRKSQSLDASGRRASRRGSGRRASRRASGVGRFNIRSPLPRLMSALDMSQSDVHSMASGTPGTPGSPSERVGPRKPSSIIGQTPRLAKMKSTRVGGKQGTGAAGGQELARKQVTLVAVNLREYLCSALAGGGAHLGVLHRRVVEQAQTHAGAHRGLIDSVAGDRTVLSLNGARPAAAHRKHGVCLAWAAGGGLPPPNRDASPTGDGGTIAASCSVCSGEVLCGVLGSDRLLRYQFIGAVAAWVHVFERLATSWETAAVVNGTARGDADTFFGFRLRDRATFTKRGHTGLPSQTLWEVVDARKDKADGEQDEWMYELERQQAGDVWRYHNTAKSALLRGDWEVALREATEGCARQDGGPGAAAAAAACEPLRAAAQLHPAAARTVVVEVQLVDENASLAASPAASPVGGERGRLLAAAANESAQCELARAADLARQERLFQQHVDEKRRVRQQREAANQQAASSPRTIPARNQQAASTTPANQQATSTIPAKQQPAGTTPANQQPAGTIPVAHAPKLSPAAPGVASTDGGTGAVKLTELTVL